MNATQDPLIDALRAATAEHHRALERTALMASLMNSDLGVAEYADVLTTFTRVFATIDPMLIDAVSSATVLPANYRYQPRLPYLQRDLNALRHAFGIAPQWQPATVTELFQHAADPNLRMNAAANHLSAAQTLGLLYVVEGASQGGKIITPRLAKKLKLKDNTGLSYFHHFAFEATDWALLRHQLASPAGEQQAQLPTLHRTEATLAAQSMFQALTKIAMELPNVRLKERATNV